MSSHEVNEKIAPENELRKCSCHPTDVYFPCQNEYAFTHCENKFLRAENERLRGVLEEAKKITDLYFAPWGAAKGAEWEFLSGDIPFTPENALRLIQRALSTEPARRG